MCVAERWKNKWEEEEKVSNFTSATTTDKMKKDGIPFYPNSSEE
jgi:hypothetical protein